MNPRYSAPEIPPEQMKRVREGLPSWPRNREIDWNADENGSARQENR